MKKRWYDQDPTLSMAVSLLQNAEPTHQEMTAKYLLKYLERHHVLDKHEMSRNQLHFIFPFMRRSRLNPYAWQLLEVMKRLPRTLQLEVALMMINHVYLLDSGMDPDLELAEPETVHPVLTSLEGGRAGGAEG